MTRKGLQLLIIDDDEGDRKIIRRALIKANMPVEIHEAVGIADAIEQYEGRIIDCAIVDYYLPGIDGIRGMGLLRQVFDNLCVVMVSGQGDEELAASAFRSGADDYLPKRLVNDGIIKQVILNAHERTTLKKRVAEQYEQLELFNRVLAHDINVPVASIRTLIETLRSEVNAGSLEDVDHLLDLMAEAGEFITRLTKELSAYNSVYEVASNKRRLHFADIVASAKNNISTVIASTKALINYDELPAVYGNDTLLIQLMQNLLMNAIQFCEEVPDIRIYDEPHKSGCCIVVEDNGIGIAREHHEIIFQPFKKLTREISNAGTGLGLATCRRIIELHGGSLWCESELGSGSKFKFILKKPT